jgi:hypothetical protein
MFESGSEMVAADQTGFGNSEGGVDPPDGPRLGKRIGTGQHCYCAVSAVPISGTDASRCDHRWERTRAVRRAETPSISLSWVLDRQKRGGGRR